MVKYVVTMYKWSNRENHSYLLGVFDNKKSAIKAGKSHEEYRGGKYSPEILEIVTNEVYYENDDKWPVVIQSLYEWRKTHIPSG